MNNFTTIMNRIKKEMNLDSDAELCRELGLKTTNYSNKKKENIVPIENIVILCEKNNLSIDFILNNNENSIKITSFKKLLEERISNLNEEDCKLFYHQIELELIKKGNL